MLMDLEFTQLYLNSWHKTLNHSSWAGLNSHCICGAYLEPSVVCAELLPQHNVEGIEGLLLQTAVHQHVDYLSLLLTLQTHPGYREQHNNTTTCI